MKKNSCPATWDDDLAVLAQSKFYLVSRRGPLIFKLRSGESESTYTVCIGSPSHRCSCGGGEAKGSICIHILFVVVKILKVPHTNPLAWTMNWSEETVDRILSGRLNDVKKHSVCTHAFLRKGDRARARKARLKEDEPSDDEYDKPTPDEACVAQRELEQSGACSICQDEMTDSELKGGLLCYCHSSCGVSFHKSCMRVFAAHARMERKKISCPLCRAPWTASLAASDKSKVRNDDDKSSARRKLPPLQCNHCRLTVRKKFVRCASCPLLDLCQSCFDGGAASSHDHAHSLLMGDVSQYPTQWQAVGPSSYRTNRLREDRERLSLLQHRELSPADYHELLSLDRATVIAPPLHEHLVNALLEVSTSDLAGQKCSFCSISLTVDRTARQFPCRPSQHIVHHSCAASIILSALSASECEGSAVGSIVCPFCPLGEESALLFPSLQRELEPEKIAKKKETSPLCDATNLGNSFGRSLATKGDDGSIKTCILSITGVMQNSNAVSKKIVGNPVNTRAKGCNMLTVPKKTIHRSMRNTEYQQSESEVDMMLSGTNYAEGQRSQQQKQTKATGKVQSKRRNTLVSTKQVSNKENTICDDGIILSGTTCVKGQTPRQWEQTKPKSRNMQNRRENKLASTKQAPKKEKRVRDDGIKRHVPSNISGILQIGGTCKNVI